MKHLVYTIIAIVFLSGSAYSANIGTSHIPNEGFLMDTSIVYVPADRYQGSPAVAFDGTNYLVVWTDCRSTNWSIYGCRVSPSGTILDTAGILISSADDSAPAVAFDGTNYLVVWQGYSSSDLELNIYGRRVSPSGTILDSAAIPISTAMNHQQTPSIAFDGVNYLVVWADRRSTNFDIYGCRVSPSGTVLDPDGLVIATAEYDLWHPSVAFDGANYLVVWEDERNGSDTDIYGCRVDPSGTVLDPEGIAISTVEGNECSPSVASDGTNYFVVWKDNRNGSDSDIYGSRLSPAGSVLDTAGLAISTGVADQWSPSLTFDGANYLVVWVDNRSGSDSDIYGSRVNPSGTVLDPEGIAISTAEGNEWYPPSVASDGTNCFVVWEDNRSGSGDIYGCRVSPLGTVMDPEGILISIAAYGQGHSLVAFDGTNYLVVWADRRNGSDPDIYGCRVSSSGTILDPAGIAISKAGGDQTHPWVAFDGTNYLVVWVDNRSGSADIYGCRVSQSGIVLDPDGIAISTGGDDQESPSVAFDGTNYLVVWRAWIDPWECDIYGARVSPGGTVLDPEGIAISTATDLQGAPSVAFDGTDYLVVWEDFRSFFSFDIYGCRVNPSGTVLDQAGIAISTAPYNQRQPTVAFDGVNYLVVWQDERNGDISGSDCDIYGARVTPSGTVLDSSGLVISTATDWQVDPAITFDGTNYLVVWEEWHLDRPSEIYGCRMNPSGEVIDSFAVAIQSGGQCSPALPVVGGSELLIAYSGFIDSINGRPANTMRIWGKFHPSTGVKEGSFKGTMPGSFVLEQNYPNPFNLVTEIKYALPKEARVRLEVYNITGEKVTTLVNGKQQAGYHSVRWDASSFASGIFFYRLQAGDFVQTKKMMLLK